MTPAWIVPDWPTPPGVRAVSTLRTGGVSPPPWHSLNLGANVGDDPKRVAENRKLLERSLGLPEAPAWLTQVHGCDVLCLDDAELPGERVADGAVTTQQGRVLAVLTADCLPVLLCRTDGQRIGIAHAGWRGLAAGVLETAFAAMESPPGEVLAWIGPGIGAAAYEVGAEVRDACLAVGPDGDDCFTAGDAGRWHCDLVGLARLRLGAIGLAGVHGGQWCTYSDPARFYSHRRDGAADKPTGRMATLIWVDRRLARRL
ncbi:MAG TPA: peptidoglycan editing factor PgeF [Gammaproteobacteria bacterium]|nr:peptidoglycan editing factor PgeF [Gammaproteobacteria bacterium]